MKTTSNILSAFLKIAFGAGLFCAAGALAAQTAPDEEPPAVSKFPEGWYVAPMVMLYKTDDERQTDDGTGVAIALGHRGEIGALEVSYVSVTLDGVTEASLTGGALTLIAGPYGDRPILSNIFGLVGFGVLRREDHPRFTENDSTIFGDVGIGYLYPLTFKGFDLGLRAEARYRYDVQQSPRPEGVPSSFEDVVLNFGFQVGFDRAESSTP